MRLAWTTVKYDAIDNRWQNVWLNLPGFNTTWKEVSSSFFPYSALSLSKRRCRFTLFARIAGRILHQTWLSPCGITVGVVKQPGVGIDYCFPINTALTRVMSLIVHAVAVKNLFHREWCQRLFSCCPPNMPRAHWNYCVSVWHSCCCVLVVGLWGCIFMIMLGLRCGQVALHCRLSNYHVQSFS